METINPKILKLETRNWHAITNANRELGAGINTSINANQIPGPMETTSTNFLGD